MIIIYYIIEILASFIEIHILYKIYATIFDELREDNYKNETLILSVIWIFIINICNYISYFSYFTLLIAVLYISISAYIIIYKTKYLVLFSIASFYIFCLSCFDFLIFSLFSNLFNGYETLIELITKRGLVRTTLIIAIKLLWILIYRFSKKYLYILGEKKSSLYVLLFTTTIGYFSFVYMVNQTFKSFKNVTASTWFIYIVFWGFILIIALSVNEIKSEKMKLSLAEIRNKILEEKYIQINDIYSQNATLYHDINQHLNVLYQLIEIEDIKGAKEYIEKISEPVTKLSKTVWTGIDIIDITLNCELEKMNRKGLLANINVEFPKNSNILSYDMCTILSNLLDNAIEATEKLEKPETISIIMRIINNFLLIRIENKCNKNLETFVHIPKTTKVNKKLHGWGLHSVLKIVEKYNGTMKCLEENGLFIVKIMLIFETKPKT